MQTFKTLSRYLLGVRFALAGLNHFVMTDFYVGIMPPYLPWPLALVYLGGVAEAGVGILLLFRRWAVWGGWGIIAVCMAGGGGFHGGNVSNRCARRSPEPLCRSIY